jgi:hypothetical protein
MGVYIGETSNLDPQIKPTLSNDIDLIFKAMENRHTKEGLTYGTHRLASLMVEPGGPSVSLLARSLVSCLLDASRVFLS